MSQGFGPIQHKNILRRFSQPISWLVLKKQNLTGIQKWQKIQNTPAKQKHKTEAKSTHKFENCIGLPMCVYHCAQLSFTTLHMTVLTIFPLTSDEQHKL